jgi:hypothetical protein
VTYTRSFLWKVMIQFLMVLGMTASVLFLGAILLPPKDSSAMPRDGGANPMTSPR